jgi:hypothetical protein
MQIDCFHDDMSLEESLVVEYDPDLYCRGTDRYIHGGFLAPPAVLQSTVCRFFHSSSLLALSVCDGDLKIGGPKVKVILKYTKGSHVSSQNSKWTCSRDGR